MITAIDKNTALVLIDLQKGILRRETAHPIKDVLNSAARLAEAFRKEGLPVVLVNVVSFGAAWQKTRKEVSMISPTGSIPPEFAEIADELHAQRGDLRITKHTWGAFFETPLHEELQKRNITGIVLGGIATSIGVEGTARGASERAYNLSFATDAMTDMSMEAHQHTLQRIFPRIGEQGTTAEIIEKLGNRAG